MITKSFSWKTTLALFGGTLLGSFSPAENLTWSAGADEHALASALGDLLAEYSYFPDTAGIRQQRLDARRGLLDAWIKSM